MRKRSKKRIPQDERPWIRVANRDEEVVNIFSRKTSHWFSGNRRYLQTKLLMNEQVSNLASIIINATSKDQRSFIDNDLKLGLDRAKWDSILKSAEWAEKSTLEVIKARRVWKEHRLEAIKKHKKLFSRIVTRPSVNTDLPSLIYQNLFHKFYFNKYAGSSKPKNFCLFSGKGRTYNRKLFISRQILRKLMKTALIIGLKKK